MVKEVIPLKGFPKTLNRNQMADVLNISLKTFYRYKSLGLVMPAEKYGQYEFLSSVQNVCNYLRKQCLIEGTKEHSELAEERLKSQKVKSEIQEHKLREMQQELISFEDLDASWRWFAGKITETYHKVRIRMKERLPHLSESDMNTLDAIISDDLNSLAEDADTSVVGTDGDLLRVSVKRSFNVSMK